MIRRDRVEKLIAKLGQSDTMMSQEELMDMRLERGKYRVAR
jgi:hypothetical protein